MKTQKDLISFEKNELSNSIVISKLLNKIMRGGKKEKVEIIFCKTLLCFKKKKYNLQLLIFYLIELLKPTLEIIPVIKSGRKYAVPAPISLPRQYKKAIHWISTSIKKSKNPTLFTALNNELSDLIFLKRGYAFLKQKTEYKKVIENRAFIHFRWK